MTSAPWPPDWPRPKSVRAVARRRADGTHAWDWYCRQTGDRLPDPIADTPAFIRAVAAARQPVHQHATGTIGAALLAWRKSPEFRALAPMTQGNRHRYTAPIDDLAGRPLHSLRRGAVLALRDAVAEGKGPAAANMLVQSTSAFLAWCVGRELLEHNPAARIPALTTGHFPPWSDAQAQVAMRAFSEPARRAVILAYYTGLRRGDLIALRWSDIDGAAIVLQPEKTRRRRVAKGLAPLRIPVHPDLAAHLAEWRRTPIRANTIGLHHILTGPSGRPWSREAVSVAVLRAVLAAGLPPGLNLHGFRKLAATRLAEAGATTHEIAAALGWESLAHVALYTRAADQARLATAAVVRLPRRKE